MSFSDVLNAVDTKHKTRFQEQTLGYKGNCLIVQSSPFLLNNGNIVQDTYKMDYAEDGCLARIIGECRLINKAA